MIRLDFNTEFKLNFSAACQLQRLRPSCALLALQMEWISEGVIVQQIIPWVWTLVNESSANPGWLDEWVDVGMEIRQLWEARSPGKKWEVGDGQVSTVPHSAGVRSCSPITSFLRKCTTVKAKRYPLPSLPCHWSSQCPLPSVVPLSFSPFSLSLSVWICMGDGKQPSNRVKNRFSIIWAIL